MLYRYYKVIFIENLLTQHNLLVIVLYIKKGRKKGRVTDRLKIKWDILSFSSALEIGKKLKTMGLGRVECIWTVCGSRLLVVLGKQLERYWVSGEAILANTKGTGGGTTM